MSYIIKKEVEVERIRNIPVETGLKRDQDSNQMKERKDHDQSEESWI